MVKRMILIVMLDFFCWVFIIFFGFVFFGGVIVLLQVCIVIELLYGFLMCIIDYFYVIFYVMFVMLLLIVCFVLGVCVGGSFCFVFEFCYEFSVLYNIYSFFYEKYQEKSFVFLEIFYRVIKK